MPDQTWKVNMMTLVYLVLYVPMSTSSTYVMIDKKVSLCLYGILVEPNIEKKRNVAFEEKYYVKILGIEQWALDCTKETNGIWINEITLV